MTDDFFERFRSETVFSPEVAESYHARGYWGGLSLGEYLDLHAEERGDEVAVVDDADSLSWAEWRRRADEIAAGLVERGVEPGDRVAFQLDHCAEWFVLRLGIHRAGGVGVPIYPRFGDREIGHVVETASPRIFVGHGGPDGPTDFESIASVAEGVEGLSTVYAYDAAPDGATPLEELRGATDGFSPVRLDPDLPDVLALSSGTTGVPKIYYLVQNSYLACGRDAMGRYSVTEYDTVFPLAPIQQALGHVAAVYLPLVTGATVAVTASNEPADQWDRFAATEPTVVVAIPTQTTKLVNAAEGGEHTLEYVRAFMHGGALLPTDVAERAEAMGALVVNGYGAGEAGVATYTRPMDPPATRYETVGPRQMSMHVTVVGDDGEAVPDGDVGEVLLRGGGTGFGYFDDRARTEEVFGVGGPWEGWFHSGDAGVIDGDGNLSIVGRLDEMIIRGGQNVYPAEIEDVLMEHEAIEEAAVVGVPDAELGERVGAYVVASAEVTVEDAAEWFDEQGLSTFKWPERLEVVDSLPKSPGGKIRKADLREDIEEKLEAEGRLP